MTSQASLSLSLLLTKVTHAQYRKRFRASYNNCGLTWLSKSKTVDVSCGARVSVSVVAVAVKAPLVGIPLAFGTQKCRHVHHVQGSANQGGPRESSAVCGRRCTWTSGWTSSFVAFVLRFHNLDLCVCKDEGDRVAHCSHRHCAGCRADRLLQRSIWWSVKWLFPIVFRTFIHKNGQCIFWQMARLGKNDGFTPLPRVQKLESFSSLLENFTEMLRKIKVSVLCHQLVLIYQQDKMHKVPSFFFFFFLFFFFKQASRQVLMQSFIIWALSSSPSQMKARPLSFNSLSSMNRRLTVGVDTSRWVSCTKTVQKQIKQKKEKRKRKKHVRGFAQTPSFTHGTCPHNPWQIKMGNLRK